MSLVFGASAKGECAYGKDDEKGHASAVSVGSCKGQEKIAR